jgi:type III restriction enzyme
LPTEEVRSGFKPFTLSLDFRFQPQSESLHGVGLRTGDHFTLDAKSAGVKEERLEDYIVSPLIDFDDISYDDHADLLYDLAGQVIEYLRGYLANENEVQNVLETKAKIIAELVHSKMLDHTWADECEYEAKVTLGFTPLKQTANSVATGDILNFKTSPADKSNMSRYLFTGFKKCLYPTAKFDSDAERRLATILDREAIKWFKPVQGQFQMYYGKEGKEYNPDFVAETEDTIYMLEPKSRKEMEDSIVLEKMKAALKWCAHATEYSKKHNGKPWIYCLIPHDEILDNKTIKGLEKEFRR